MSQQPSDVLAMLLIATEVGVANALDLVLLFETLDDLHRSAEMMAILFANSTYRQHLVARSPGSDSTSRSCWAILTVARTGAIWHQTGSSMSIR